MEAFYTYIYGNIIPLWFIALGLGFGGMIVSQRRSRRLGMKLMKAGLVADFAIAGVYLASFFILCSLPGAHRADDLIFALFWIAIAYWNFRQLRKL